MNDPLLSATQPLIIYGAGGHGQVVAEAAELSGFDVLGFVDDNEPEQDAVTHAPGYLTLPMLDLNHPACAAASIIVAIGDNAARRRVTERLLALGRDLATVIHPAAWVSPSASLRPGVFVGSQAVVHTAAAVDVGAIINTAAVVEHHCKVAAFAHIAPAAALGGEVVVGDCVLVGLGARVMPQVRLGDKCIIGAGAVVITDVAEESTVVGVPARST